MNDDIDELNRLAKELLSKVTDLETTVDGQGSNALSPQRLTKVRSLLDSMCKGLTDVEKILSRPGGPLEQLIQYLDGVPHLSPAADAADRFLDAHKKTLRRIGVPAKIVDSLIKDLEEEIRKGLIRLNEAATLSSDDGKEIVTQLRALRDLVCAINADADLLAQVWDPELAKACIDGVKGVCQIVFDITGAIGAPHVTAFVFVIAVKSTWSGYRAVRASVEKMSARWSGLKQAVGSKLKQDKLRDKAPRVVLKRKPEDK